MSQMRFGEFIWPNNPRSVRVSRARSLRRLRLASGRAVVQDLGPEPREVTGEGEFLGEERASAFAALAELWAQGGARLLCLPGETPFEAHLQALTRQEEPGETLRYAFSFLEAGATEKEEDIPPAQPDGQEQSPWLAAARLGVTIEQLQREEML